MGYITGLTSWFLWFVGACIVCIILVLCVFAVILLTCYGLTFSCLLLIVSRFSRYSVSKQVLIVWFQALFQAVYCLFSSVLQSVFVCFCCFYSPFSIFKFFVHPKNPFLPFFLQVATRLKAAINPDKPPIFVICSMSSYGRNRTQKIYYPGYIYIFTSKIKIKKSFMLSPPLVTQKSIP